MQRHREACHSELSVQAKSLEAEEIFSEFFGKVATHELLAAIIESSRSIRASICKSGTQEIRKMCLHTIMHDSEFSTKTLHIVLDVAFQALNFKAVLAQCVKDNFFVGECLLPLCSSFCS